MEATGRIATVNGNMISVAFDGAVAQNEVGYAELITDGDDARRLMCEVVRIRGARPTCRSSRTPPDLRVGDKVSFTGDLLSVELGPGLLGQVYDGLQNPLPRLAEQCGFFLQRGTYLEALLRDKTWDFTPKAGRRQADGRRDARYCTGGDFRAPHHGALQSRRTCTVDRGGRPPGDYTVDGRIATLKTRTAGSR
jgi:vacuolar-type H+-ATPase catalytic subunit A/Vma1